MAAEYDQAYFFQSQIYMKNGTEEHVKCHEGNTINKTQAVGNSTGKS